MLKQLSNQILRPIVQRSYQRFILPPSNHHIRSYLRPNFQSFSTNAILSNSIEEEEHSLPKTRLRATGMYLGNRLDLQQLHTNICQKYDDQHSVKSYDQHSVSSNKYLKSLLSQSEMQSIYYNEKKGILLFHFYEKQDYTGFVSGYLPDSDIPINDTITTNDRKTPYKKKKNHLDPQSFHSLHGKDKWIVYFNYGAIILFNCDAYLTNQIQCHARQFSTRAKEEVHGHIEVFDILHSPNLSHHSILQEDGSVLLREINEKNIQIISRVLGQTVALEQYETLVNVILGEMQTYCKEKESTSKTKAFQHIAICNSIVIDVLNKLKLAERQSPNSIAWTEESYYALWDTLSKEYELKERFHNINYKVELIQDNAKLFLEELESDTMHRLEKYIIIIIILSLFNEMWREYTHRYKAMVANVLS